MCIPQRPASPQPSDSENRHPSAERASQRELVRRLQQQVDGVFAGEVASSASADSQDDESMGRFRRHAVSEGHSVSSGCSALDGCLPGASGFRRGSLVEWFVEGAGNGAGTLALLIARQACRDGGTLVVVDPAGQFYPPAAAACGIDLQRLVVIRPERSRDALWAWEQSLRCSAVKAVWGRLDAVNDRWFRRFQLAAQRSGCLGLFLRPVKYRGTPSWSELQLAVSAWPAARQPEDSHERAEVHRFPDATPTPVLVPAKSRLIRVELVRHRGALGRLGSTGPPGEQSSTVYLNLEERHGHLQVIEASRHETPALHLVSELADPAIPGRPTRV